MVLVISREGMTDFLECSSVLDKCVGNYKLSKLTMKEMRLMYYNTSLRKTVKPIFFFLSFLVNVRVSAIEVVSGVVSF